MALKTVTDATFTEDVLQSDKPVLVDYWAVWCGPCRMIAPILEEIDKTHSEKLQIAKLNVDENPQTASTYGITSIPAVLVFQGGEKVATSIGAKPQQALESEFAQYLA